MKIAKLLGPNSGTIPYSWNSTIKVPYDWREHPGNFEPYRGITLECTTFKVPAKLRTQNESADECSFRLRKGPMDAESIYLVRLCGEIVLRMTSGKFSDEIRTMYWLGTCNGQDADRATSTLFSPV